MLNKRETVLIVLMLIILTGTSYFVLFLQPKLNEIAAARASVASKEESLLSAQEMMITYQPLLDSYEQKQEEWNGLAGTIPEYFDDAEILRLIQRVVYDNTDLITVDMTLRADEYFGMPETDAEGGEIQPDEDAAVPAYMSRAVIGFYATYEELAAIWEGFEAEDILNRIVHYNIEREENELINEFTNEVSYYVALSVDFLTQQ